IDRRRRPVVTVLRCEDQGYPRARQRRTTVYVQTAAVKIIDSGIESYDGASVELYAAAIDSRIDRFGVFASVILLSASGERWHDHAGVWVGDRPDARPNAIHRRNIVG